MNQLHILIAVVASIAVALGGFWVLNHAYAQDNATMMAGNVTGNMTAGNATMMAGNMTSADNSTGTISSRGH